MGSQFSPLESLSRPGRLCSGHSGVQILTDSSYMFIRPFSVDTRLGSTSTHPGHTASGWPENRGHTLLQMGLPWWPPLKSSWPPLKATV